MNPDERRALSTLRFNYTPNHEDVWMDWPFHVEDLHGEVADTIRNGLTDAARSPAASPLGIVIEGQRGAGKTHLIGWVRQHAVQNDGYFCVVDLSPGNLFWDAVAKSLVHSLLRTVDGGQTQLTRLLRDIAAKAGLSVAAQAALSGGGKPSKSRLDKLTDALQRRYPTVGLECEDAVRAFVLLCSTDPDARIVGRDYLACVDDEVERRRLWGIRSHSKTTQMIVREISWLISLSGPLVVAVDQMDAYFRQPTGQTDSTPDEDHRQAMSADLSDGLMALRELTRRTLILVSCLPRSWRMIEEAFVEAVTSRFRVATHLANIPSAAIAQSIVEKRFGACFRDVGFEPRYASWPVNEKAFVTATTFTVRGLLEKIEDHVNRCLKEDVATELYSFDELPEPGPGPKPPEPPREELATLDARFDELRAKADVKAALDPQTEDDTMSDLLTAALEAWTAELGLEERMFYFDKPVAVKPDLHARLRLVIDETTEDEKHWAFRSIASPDARAALSRLRGAISMAGVSPGSTKRRLFLLRNVPWSQGEKTQQELDRVASANGRHVLVSNNDLRTFFALRMMLAERHSNLHRWLELRRHASDSELLSSVLDDAVTDRVGRNSGAGKLATKGLAEPSKIQIGISLDSRMPVSVDLSALRKHTVIFAGSGSGKTVLIRRILEECALRGVSAIVLDPNNDLSQLGDRSPEPSAHWEEGDADLAEDYFANTEVIVWTPRREGGRPLSFQPLPDFASVRDDADEFNEAVDAAVAALAPRAKVDGKTVRAVHARAVLHEALRYFARDGGGSLGDFIDVLSDLPADVSRMARAATIASGIAETLMATMVTDPLFGGTGQSVDPGVLLKPSAGKRARISIISFVGLPMEEQRQSFVNQLQMALFTWIKRNPARGSSLGGLFVMDEAQTLVPSQRTTACTRSTISLSSQARKYGLGLVFATQAPRALDNNIPGNAATQFFGFLNSPVQIAAAQELAKAKGSAVLDISRLAAGQFYLATEGHGFEMVQTPFCLSHHASPLTPEEVIERSRTT